MSNVYHVWTREKCIYLSFDFAVHGGCRLATSRSTDLPDSIKKSLVSIGGTVSKVACAWRHQLIEVRSRMLNPTKTTRALSYIHTRSKYARAKFSYAFCQNHGPPLTAQRLSALRSVPKTVTT